MSLMASATRTEHQWPANSKSRRKACGECRRLKLRCEKVFPCESCQKRGCAAICPDGSFLKGTRSLKTSALKLHEKMTHMSTRIRLLEDALSDLQASVSAEKHPLLMGNDEDDRSRSPIPVAAVVEAHVPVSETPDELSEALGSLTIRPFGESQFHGETAASEFLLQVNSETQILATAANWDPSAGGRQQLPPDLVLLSVLFPFPPSIPGEPTRVERFTQYIPNYEEALRLSDTYFTNFAWCAMPITKEELHTSIFEAVYRSGPEITLESIGLHRLSLLLMIFALGSLFDVNKPLYPAEAEEYHSLARAALCGEQIFNNTTLDCVQSMSLMIWYMRLCRRRSRGYLWAFSGLLSKLVQAIGLHRESNKSMSSQEILRRQVTFWEYISGDIWQSFVYGRPSSMVFSQIDCKMPREFGGLIDRTAGLFYKWKYTFTRLVGDILAQTTGATTTTYRNVLELEHKLRVFPLQVALQMPDAPGQDVPLTLFLQRYVIRLWQHTTLMAIHRRFLVQAIRSHPDDLTKSPYLQSVYAAYESACVIVMDLHSLYMSHQPIVCRMQPYWSHSFSAAIVLGALVIRSPSCIVADAAMAYLDQIYDLFADAVTRSVQPPNGLETITTLKEKARASLAEYRTVHGDTPRPEYIAMGSSSTSHDIRKASSPTSPQTYETAVQYVHATTRPASPPPQTPLQPPEQTHASYAAQWLQHQTYFHDADFPVSQLSQAPYTIGEDDEQATQWLSQQAFYTDRSSGDIGELSQSGFGTSSVIG